MSGFRVTTFSGRPKGGPDSTTAPQVGGQLWGERGRVIDGARKTRSYVDRVHGTRHSPGG